jgi:hypothetical protein
LYNSPRLKQVYPKNPLHPLVAELNKAVRDQADIRPGNGFGVMGRAVRRTSEDWIVGYTIDPGAPAAIQADDELRWTLGKGDALECTIEIDDEDEVSIVLARPDDEDEEDAATKFTYYNPHSTDIGAGTLVFFEKRFGFWMPFMGEFGGLARAKCTEEIPTGTFDSPGSGEAQIYRKDGDGDWVASGDPVTVLCQHTMDSSVPVDGTIHIAKIGGDWWLITRDC